MSAGHMLTDGSAAHRAHAGGRRSGRGSRCCSAGEASSSLIALGVWSRDGRRNAKTPAPEGTGVSRVSERQALILSRADFLAGAAAGADVGEALLEELLELGKRTTLEQHVPVACAGPCRRGGRRSRCPRRCAAATPRRTCGTPRPREPRHRRQMSWSCHVRKTCTCRCAVRVHGTRRPLRSVGSGRRVGCRADCGLPFCGPLVASQV